ncbi:MAG: GTPase ObgE [Phycisphaerae bacterium]
MPERFTEKAVFVDEIELSVTAGDGGDGAVSFRRERFVPRGGPDGGDGGDGGSVFVVADSSYTTLQHLTGHRQWHAKHGGRGTGKKCHGRKGQDVYIRVPPGTIIYDADHGIVLKDLSTDGESVCVAPGGRGGRGNVHFRSSTNQAPRQAEQGEPGRSRRLRLELKLIADAGLVGKPNAGKSTLLSRISAARPKVAAYPFTTRYPVLGIVEMAQFRRFVMADIPGLIEGAHEGAGLGDEFLRHIERTRVLVHVIDIAGPGCDGVESYHEIRHELSEYSPTLADKPEIVAANKMDLTGAEEQLHRMQRELPVEVVGISAVTGEGLEQLTEQIWQMLEKQQEQT